MKRYIRSNRNRGRIYDYAGAGYSRKTLTLTPSAVYDYDYSKGGEAYICYFTDDNGDKYAYYCQNGNSPIFDKINNDDLSPMKISCQVKDRPERDGKYWILRPRLLK